MRLVCGWFARYSSRLTRCSRWTDALDGRRLLHHRHMGGAETREDVVNGCWLHRWQNNQEPRRQVEWMRISVARSPGVIASIVLQSCTTGSWASPASSFAVQRTGSRAEGLFAQHSPSRATVLWPRPSQASALEHLNLAARHQTDTASTVSGRAATVQNRPARWRGTQFQRAVR